MYKLLTVDVWDTLLRRDCHPECIKLATAAHLFYSPDRLVSSVFKSHWEIYFERLRVEGLLADKAEAQGLDREYEIVAVLSHWLHLVCKPGFPQNLPLHLGNYELGVEVERTYVDPTVLKLLSSIESEDRLYLSDFYMNSEFMKKLLRSKGIDAVIKDGLVSCDVGLNKRSGSLFKHVHGKFGIEPQQHIHIGDNQWSDVDCPTALGVSAHLFKPKVQHAQREVTERLFSSREILFSHINAEIVQNIESHLPGCSTQADAAFRMGATVAPLFIGFILDVIEKSISDRVDTICYLTREGEFLIKLHRVLLRRFANRFGHAYPPAVLLEVSRISTFGASLKSLSIEDLGRMWRIHGRLPIAGFFASLGLECSDFYDLLGELGISLEETIENPESDSRFLRLIKSTAFASAVEQRILKQRSLLEKHLYSSGILEGMRIGIVDVGWRGSIQDNLANILPASSTFGYYLGLKRFVEPQGVNVRKHAWLINEEHGLTGIEAKCLESFTAIEMLCGAESGSVTAYAQGEQGVLAIRADDPAENAAFQAYVKHFQDGVLHSVDVWSDYINRYVVSGSELRVLGLRIWGEIGRSPDQDLADVFMNTPQHDAFCFGDTLNRAEVPSLSSIFMIPISSSSRKIVKEFIGRVQWTSAIASLPQIGWFHKWVLVSLFVFSNLYRRTRVNLRTRFSIR